MLDLRLNRGEMTEVIAETCNYNDITDGYVRLVATRGIGDLGLLPHDRLPPTLFCIASRLSLYDPAIYETGMPLITAVQRRIKPTVIDPQIKSLNYLNNILAKIEAVRAGVPEALMLTDDGIVAECTGENVFIVKEGVLITPPCHVGILNGITRQTIIQLASNLGMRLQEKEFTLFNVYAADECFLTGTAAEIVPVSSVDGREIGELPSGTGHEAAHRRFPRPDPDERAVGIGGLAMTSDNVKNGPERAPHRSLLRAMGYTQREIAAPWVGIVNAWNELIPGHIQLDRIAAAAKAGVLAAGGTPMEFPSIGVCDGLAMGHAGMHYSLPSRELIADSIETMALAHQLDALVLVTNCDKITPGMLMAAARVNIPAVLVSGGPMLAGRIGERALNLNSVFEAVGTFKDGRLSDGELREIEEHACPGCGSCAGMFTANSMNCLAEALGMALPGNGTILAVDAGRIRLAKAAGDGGHGLARAGHPSPGHHDRSRPSSMPWPSTWRSAAARTASCISRPSPTRRACP